MLRLPLEIVNSRQTQGKNSKLDYCKKNYFGTKQRTLLEEVDGVGVQAQVLARLEESDDRLVGCVAGHDVPARTINTEVAALV